MSNINSSSILSQNNVKNNYAPFHLSFGEFDRSSVITDPIFSSLQNKYEFDSMFFPMFHYMAISTQIIYKKAYPYEITDNTLLTECQILSDIAASILFNPAFFVFDKENSIFKYESKFFDYGFRDFVMRYAIDSLWDKGLTFMTEVDLETYAKIVYKVIYDIHNRFSQFFLKVKELGGYNFSLAKVDSATRNHVRFLILKFMYENPEANNTQIAKIFGVNRKTVIEINKEYDRQTTRLELELPCTRIVEKNKLLELLLNSKFELNIKKVEVEIKAQKKFHKPLCINYEAVRERPRGPRPVLFTAIPEDIWVQFLDDIANKTPLDFGLSGSTWTCQQIVDYFKKVHDIDVTRKYVYYLLRKFEVTSKFARRLNPKRKLAEVISFVQKRFKLICEEARKNGERIAFIDETHCNQDYHQRGYALIGIRSNMSFSNSAAHTTLSLLVIASPDGLIEIFKVDGTFNAEVFKKCIQELHKRHPSDKFVLIADNARVHHAKLIKQWLNTLEKLKRNYFRLEFLPAYCPELNPVEFFNNDFKSYLRRMALRNADDVRKATDEYIHEYVDTKSIEERVKNFFKAPSCVYSWKIYNEIFHDELNSQLV